MGAVLPCAGRPPLEFGGLRCIAQRRSGVEQRFDVYAVFLGGASLTGGKGSIVGTLLGVLFVTTLANGLTQMGARPEVVPIVNGILLITAVAIDQRPKGGYR